MNKKLIFFLGGSGVVASGALYYRYILRHKSKEIDYKNRTITLVNGDLYKLPEKGGSVNYGSLIIKSTASENDINFTNPLINDVITIEYKTILGTKVLERI